jgi:hypothetical protein
MTPSRLIATEFGDLAAPVAVRLSAFWLQPAIVLPATTTGVDFSVSVFGCGSFAAHADQTFAVASLVAMPPQKGERGGR